MTRLAFEVSTASKWTTGGSPRGPDLHDGHRRYAARPPVPRTRARGFRRPADVASLRRSTSRVRLVVVPRPGWALPPEAERPSRPAAAGPTPRATSAGDRCGRGRGRRACAGRPRNTWSGKASTRTVTRAPEFAVVHGRLADIASVRRHSNPEADNTGAYVPPEVVRDAIAAIALSDDTSSWTPPLAEADPEVWAEVFAEAPPAPPDPRRRRKEKPQKERRRATARTAERVSPVMSTTPGLRWDAAARGSVPGRYRRAGTRRRARARWRSTPSRSCRSRQSQTMPSTTIPTSKNGSKPAAAPPLSRRAPGPRVLARRRAVGAAHAWRLLGTIGVIVLAQRPCTARGACCHEGARWGGADNRSQPTPSAGPAPTSDASGSAINDGGRARDHRCRLRCRALGDGYGLSPFAFRRDVCRTFRFRLRADERVPEFGAKTCSVPRSRTTWDAR